MKRNDINMREIGGINQRQFITVRQYTQRSAGWHHQVAAL